MQPFLSWLLTMILFQHMMETIGDFLSQENILSLFLSPGYISAIKSVVVSSGLATELNFVLKQPNPTTVQVPVFTTALNLFPVKRPPEGADDLQKSSLLPTSTPVISSPVEEKINVPSPASTAVTEGDLSYLSIYVRFLLIVSLCNQLYIHKN